MSQARKIVAGEKIVHIGKSCRHSFAERLIAGTFEVRVQPDQAFRALFKALHFTSQEQSIALFPAIAKEKKDGPVRTEEARVTSAQLVERATDIRPP